MCSSDAEPEQLFATSKLTQRDIDDRRMLMDDLNISMVSSRKSFF